MSGWIDVTKQLPPDDERVLIVYGVHGHAVCIGYRSNRHGKWFDDDGSATNNVTHWMPIPEAPDDGSI